MPIEVLFIPDQRKRRIMRAVRFDDFGDPSVLKLTEVAKPAPDDDTALKRGSVIYDALYAKLSADAAEGRP